MTSAGKDEGWPGYLRIFGGPPQQRDGKKPNNVTAAPARMKKGREKGSGVGESS